MGILSTDGTKILDNYDRFTGVPFNASKVTNWLDGTPMDDSKVDNVIYFKNTPALGGGYSRRDFDQKINVKWFGAKGDNVINDSIAFIEAQSYVGAFTSISIGAELFVPKGIYNVDKNTIKLSENMSISGEGKSSVILGASDYSDINSTGIKINGNGCAVKNLYIRGYSCGVDWDTKPQTTIEGCTFSYNRIGMRFNGAYISNITSNYITFNQIGVVSTGQSYEVLIQNNVIDNNTSSASGGLGLYLSGSIGIKLINNTIEGNRNTTTGIGCGVYVAGLGAMFLIDGNWFETNQEPTSFNEYSSDIYFASDINSDFQTALKSSVLLPEYLSSMPKAYGSIIISNNFHYQTKNGIVIGKYDFGLLDIRNDVFSGKRDGFNRPIFLNMPNLFYENVIINLDNIFAQNTGSDAEFINAEMFSGIKKTLIHGLIPSIIGGSILILLNGKDVSIYETTLLNFITNLGVVMTDAITSTGTTRVFRDKKLNNAYLGVSKYSGGVYLGAVDVIDSVGDFNGIIGITEPLGGFNYTATSPTDVINPETPGKLKIVRVSNADITSPSMFHASTAIGRAVFGYCFLTQAILDTDLLGITHIQIIDFESRTSIPRGSLPQSLVTGRIGIDGDIIINSASTGPLAAIWQNGSWKILGQEINTGTFATTDEGQATILIPHGLGIVPSFYNVVPKNAAANNLSKASINADATNIILTPAFTNNDHVALTYLWQAKP